MAMEKGRALPKFGEWDVKNPASAEGFTVIFQKARDDKKTISTAQGPGGIKPALRNNVAANGGGYKSDDRYTYPQKSVKKNKWLCCG